jgi:hypothetical protein
MLASYANLAASEGGLRRALRREESRGVAPQSPIFTDAILRQPLISAIAGWRQVGSS